MDVLRSHRTNASVHLDAIRGAAALVVFLGHGRSLFLSAGLRTQQHGSSTASSPSPRETPRTTVGHEAVILFFVLSGYFVGGSVLRSTKRKSFAWGKYVFQRLTRLWVVLVPALFLGLIVDLTGLHVFGGQAHSIYAGVHGTEVVPGLASRLSLTCFLGNVVFLQDSFVSTFGTNLALWSLACEFWYYLFFPLLLKSLQRGDSPQRRVAYGCVLLALMWFCGPRVAMYFPLWLAGCGVAMLPQWKPRPVHRWLTPTFGLALCATLFLGLRGGMNLYVADVLICVAFSALLWAMLHNQRRTLNRAYTRAAQGMAGMSYTLYTVHFPLLVLTSAMLSPVWHPAPMSARVLEEMVVSYVSVFAVATGMYFLFERNTEQIRGVLMRSWFGRFSLGGAIHRVATRSSS
jgi:peptidoglycan/LPS O-acetylase OafA/YrhL